MEFLFKLFIKDKDNVTNENVRRAYGVFGGICGIILNTLLFVFKITAGIITGSISIVADAINNISDAASSLITLIGFKLSGKPAHNDHPFGHGRIEYISALFVSIAILLMGFELAKSSVGKIITPSPVKFPLITVTILVVAIFVKTWMYFFNKKIGKKISSGSMMATARDSISDAAATLAVLAGIIVTHTLKINIDGYIGLLVSLFIFFTGVKSISESLSPLLGQSPDPKLVKEIEEIVLSHENILGIHDLIIHDYGPTRFMISLHTEVPASVDFIAIHDSIDHIERELEERFNCDAVIHLDPIETDNEVVNENRKVVEKIVKSISEKLSFHDFRMVSGPTHTNLIFDVVIPTEFDMTKKELDEEIKKKIAEYNSDYFAVVEYDLAYTSHEE